MLLISAEVGVKLNISIFLLENAMTYLSGIVVKNFYHNLEKLFFDFLIKFVKHTCNKLL